MSFQKNIICFILSVLLLLSLTGCDKSQEAYLYFELPQQPVTLDPQTAETTAELLVTKNVFEGLMRLDAAGKPVCGVCESYEVSGNTYTFHIRKNAKWNNETALTADDFVFALQRAVSPETKSPFVQRLFAIKNARSIYSGSSKSSSLGVVAKDDKTLVIELAEKDDRFLESLATSIAMPCNRAFFESTDGKYGLNRDCIVSNGSYRLAKWDKDNFGIRLYKNEHYSGTFTAKNAAVFLTCSEDETAVQKLSKNSIDIAFIDSSDCETMQKNGFGTKNIQNICWVMTLGKDFGPELRKSFAMLTGSDVYQNDLPGGYTPASSLLPGILTSETVPDGITLYNAEQGIRLFNRQLDTFEEGRFPSDVILYYYDNGTVKPMVTDIVGHWQNKLSAFVNIESVSSPDLLTSQLTDQTYRMAIFPVTAENSDAKEYLKQFGVSYNGESLASVQKSLLESNRIIPLAFQNTCICYTSAIQTVPISDGDGYIDFSFIVKQV